MLTFAGITIIYKTSKNNKCVTLNISLSNLIGNELTSIVRVRKFECEIQDTNPDKECLRFLIQFQLISGLLGVGLPVNISSDIMDIIQ